MSNISPQTLERPPTITSTSTGPAQLILVLTAVVALVAGLLIGWFAHQPQSTSAYSKAGAVSAAVYFDGTHASYAGPAELKTGTVLTLRLVSDVPEASMAVSRLSPAPSWATLTHDLATANSATAVMPLSYVRHMVTVNAGATGSVRLTKAGVYSVWAGPAASGSASVVLATLIRVTG